MLLAKIQGLHYCRKSTKQRITNCTVVLVKYYFYVHFIFMYICVFVYISYYDNTIFELYSSLHVKSAIVILFFNYNSFPFPPAAFISPLIEYSIGFPSIHRTTILVLTDSQVLLAQKTYLNGDILIRRSKYHLIQSADQNYTINLNFPLYGSKSSMKIEMPPNQITRMIQYTYNI